MHHVRRKATRHSATLSHPAPPVNTSRACFPVSCFLGSQLVAYSSILAVCSTPVTITKVTSKMARKSDFGPARPTTCTPLQRRAIIHPGPFAPQIRLRHCNSGNETREGLAMAHQLPGRRTASCDIPRSGLRLRRSHIPNIRPRGAGCAKGM